MTAKQYLNRVRRIDKEIDRLLEVKKETSDRLMRITQNYAADGAQVTKDPHKYDRLVELESMIDEKIDEMVGLKKEILSTIMRLDDRRQRLVLIEYYIDTKTFEEIAVDLHYSWRQVHRVHAAALKAVEKIMS